MVTVLRTFAPAHFENGVWNTGGYCNRTGPVSESEVDFGKFDWEVRGIQMEEFERARREGTMGKLGHNNNNNNNNNNNRYMVSNNVLQNTKNYPLFVLVLDS